jgi:hypothetical protein
MCLAWEAAPWPRVPSRLGQHDPCVGQCSGPPLRRATTAHVARSAPFTGDPPPGSGHEAISDETRKGLSSPWGRRRPHREAPRSEPGLWPIAAPRQVSSFSHASRDPVRCRPCNRARGFRGLRLLVAASRHATARFSSRPTRRHARGRDLCPSPAVGQSGASPTWFPPVSNTCSRAGPPPAHDGVASDPEPGAPSAPHPLRPDRWRHSLERR